MKQQKDIQQGPQAADCKDSNRITSRAANGKGWSSQRAKIAMGQFPQDLAV